MIQPCILVAEDDPVVRRMTIRALEPCGYQLLEAADGHKALTVASQFDGRIDLLISNVNMPRMTGHELAQAIKQARPDICVLIVSSEREEDFPPYAIHHADALLKPVEPRILVEKVRMLLAKTKH